MADAGGGQRPRAASTSNSHDYNLDEDEGGSAQGGKNVIVVRERAKRGARAVSPCPVPCVRHERAQPIDSLSFPQCVSCRRLKKTVRRPRQGSGISGGHTLTPLDLFTFSHSAPNVTVRRRSCSVRSV